MTDQEINRKIAEKLGWKVNTTQDTLGWTDHNPALRLLPNYAQDLNACYEVERGLTDDQRTLFRGILAGKFTPRSHAVHAKARQRAEALLATLEAKEEG